MTYPNALFAAADGVALAKARRRRRWARSDGRPCDRRHDRSLRRDRSGLLPELCRFVEIDTDDTTSILFRMKDGMSGYLGTITTTGPVQLPGVRLQGLATARGRHPCRRRVLGGAAHAPVRRLQVPARERAAGGLGCRTPRLRPRDIRSLCARRRRRAAVPDPARARCPRRVVTEAVSPARAEKWEPSDCRAKQIEMTSRPDLGRPRDWKTQWISATASVT